MRRRSFLIALAAALAPQAALAESRVYLPLALKRWRPPTPLLPGAAARVAVGDIYESYGYQYWWFDAPKGVIRWRQRVRWAAGWRTIHNMDMNLIVYAYDSRYSIGPAWKCVLADGRWPFPDIYPAEPMVEAEIAGLEPTAPGQFVYYLDLAVSPAIAPIHSLVLERLL